MNVEALKKLAAVETVKELTLIIRKNELSIYYLIEVVEKDRDPKGLR